MRDMKSSLSSGMMLLLTLWLIFGNTVAKVDQGDSLTGNIRRLMDYLGPAGSLGLIAFVGYLVGMVLSLDRAVMYLLLERKWKKSGPPVLLVSATSYQRLSKKLTAEIRAALDKAPAGVVLKSTVSDADRTRDRLTSMNLDEIEVETYLHNQIVTSLIDDLDIVAVQLHSKHDKAYDQYDKAKSEAAFRAALVFPSLLLAFVLAARLISEDQLMLALVLGVGIGIAALLLLREAAKKRAEANEELFNAFIVGHIVYAPVLTLSEIAQGALKPEAIANTHVASPVGRIIRR
ncbi:hypothetical protein [Arthrobacter sp. TE12232]